MPKPESKVEFIELSIIPESEVSIPNTVITGSSVLTQQHDEDIDEDATYPHTDPSVLVQQPVNVSLPFAYKIKSYRIRKVIKYMLEKYGNEKSCIMVTYNALKELGVNKSGPMIIDDFKFELMAPKTPDEIDGIFLVKLDIYSVDPEIFKQYGGAHGDHIHSLLIIIDYYTYEYQILMAFNHSFTLKEFYTGKLDNPCAGNPVKPGSVAEADLKSFKEYRTNMSIPYASNTLVKLIPNLHNLSANNFNNFKMVGNRLGWLNLLCGFENFNKEYDVDNPEKRGCFEHNIKGKGTAHPVLFCEIARVRHSFISGYDAS